VPGGSRHARPQRASAVHHRRQSGLRRAISALWPTAAVQRCCVHKLRNLERKAPKHALADLRAAFHQIVYAHSVEAARTASTAFDRTWTKRCPAVAKSLREGGDELLTFVTFPKAQWKTIRTTNVIERLNGEFRRRVNAGGRCRRTMPRNPALQSGRERAHHAPQARRLA
jgi:transposase-like protein